eukprot:COSAG06_NODE_860_length_11903_cov_3.097170_12_plen_86_part_00
MITLSLHYTQPPLHSAYGLQFHGSHVNMASVCRVVCNIDSFAIGIMAHYWSFPTLEYPRDFHNELHMNRITLTLDSLRRIPIRIL